MLDTGASVSLVSTRLIDTMQLNNDIKPTNTLISGLGNRIIPMRGQMDLVLKIGTYNIKHIFIVCDNIENEFLLGIDIIKMLNLCIDFSDRKIIMPDGNNIPFMDKPSSIKKRLKIRCNKTVIIPGNTSLYLDGKIPTNNAKCNYEGIIEPFKNLAKNSGIFVTGSLSYTKQNIVQVNVLNPSPWPVTVYKNQLIAFMDPFKKLENVEKVQKIKKEGHFYDSSIDIPRLENAPPVEVTKAQGKWINPDKLIETLKINEIDIPDDKKDELISLVKEFDNVFSRDKNDLGCSSFYQARLNLKHDFQPKWVPSRILAPKIQEHVDQEIEHLEKSGQIEPCTYSLWNNAVFAVEKSDGSYRFVVDARALNSQITRDHYALPNLKNVLNNISETKYWSSFDLTSSFTQIELEEKSRPLTAFTNNGRRYQWNRLIQGQSNSSSEFSRMMAQLFSKVPFKSLLIYIDDILMASNSITEHLSRLRFIFERLQ